MTTNLKNLERAAKALEITADRPDREWRYIRFARTYAVSDDGLVASFACSEPKILTPGTDAGLRIVVSVFGRPVTVAQLLREAFGKMVDPRTLKPLSEAHLNTHQQLAALKASSQPPRTSQAPS